MSSYGKLVSSILTLLQLKYKIMYETLEHWKQYKQEKELQAKIAKEFKLDKLISKQEALKELDEFLAGLRKKNGQTKSVLS